jgi:hypothetical protein
MLFEDFEQRVDPFRWECDGISIVCFEVTAQNLLQAQELCDDHGCGDEVHVVQHNHSMFFDLPVHRMLVRGQADDPGGVQFLG